MATRNEGKVRELREMLRDLDIEVLSLQSFANVAEVEEDGLTFYENALKKAREVSLQTHEMVLADDSGLEVDVLGNEPGIQSARYSGPRATDETNNRKLLLNLETVPKEKRGASFRCVLVFYRPGEQSEAFEGSWRGEILFEPRGTLGFGYDPLFFDPQKGLTAAELSPEIKNRISHRGKAFAKFREWIKQQEKG